MSEDLSRLDNIQEFEFSNSPVEWKYADCNSSVSKIYESVLDKYFKNDPCIKDANVRFIYYSKLRRSRGKEVYAFVKKPSDFESYLDSRTAGEPSNYFMFIDYYLWNNLPDEYKERLMRHEVRHFDIDFNKDGDMVFGLKDHDFADFEVDMDIESKPGGDPKWHSTLAEISEKARAELDSKSEDED